MISNSLTRVEPLRACSMNRSLADGKLHVRDSETKQKMKRGKYIPQGPPEIEVRCRSTADEATPPRAPQASISDYICYEK